MPTARPFAFNPGAPIAGTEQVGQIAVGLTTQNYSSGYGGVRWWNGPDEDLGYVICYSVPTLDHPSPDGNIAGVGFFRSELLTEDHSTSTNFKVVISLIKHNLALLSSTFYFLE